ncbi:MAG TPA: hypothetical protein VFQ45_11410, partial [Longimicrobium sp.]|nr:hypothetical protein [Longimicrobium sp.]
MRGSHPGAAGPRPLLRPALVGAALALPFIPIFDKDYDRALDFLTLLLPFTTALYLGAALSGGARRDVVLESVVAAL